MSNSAPADGGPELTGSGHTGECPQGAHQAASRGHEDIFCDGCHDWFTEPHILANGTDIAWPSGWTRGQAAAWRGARGLTKASEVPQAGPHDRPGLTNEIATQGTGMLPPVGEANQGDMAPGG